MYDFLMDKLKDFTGRQLQMHGEWLERHINEFVEEYSHIQIGSTVTQILTDENGDVLPDENTVSTPATPRAHVPDKESHLTIISKNVELSINALSKYKFLSP